MRQRLFIQGCFDRCAKQHVPARNWGIALFETFSFGSHVATAYTIVQSQDNFIVVKHLGTQRKE